MLSALNCARDYGDSHCHLFVDVNIQSKVSRMSHTWVTPSSSARVQGQRSSGHRTQHSGRQEPGRLRARGEPDAQFTGVRRPGAVAPRRTQSSEDERSGYGHTQPLDRSDRRYEGEGIVRPEHEQRLSDSQPGRLQRYSEHCSFSDGFIVCVLSLPAAVKKAFMYNILIHPRTNNY